MELRRKADDRYVLHVMPFYIIYCSVNRKQIRALFLQQCMGQGDSNWENHLLLTRVDFVMA